MDQTLLLPDDLLCHLCMLACRPLPWPWHHTLVNVCRRWRCICERNQSRYWFVMHSSINVRDACIGAPISGTPTSRCPPAALRAEAACQSRHRGSAGI